MNKIKKLAEDFLAKYPTTFSTDFEANKKGLDQIAVIHNRTLRNQIAGAITVLAKANAGAKSSHEAPIVSAVASAGTADGNETPEQGAK